MTPLRFGMVAGIGFGGLAVASMVPLEFADRTTALTAAFASRFAIGFLIPLVKLPLPMSASGALVGLLVSLPDAIVTQAFAPILGMGTLGGAAIGWLAGRFCKI